MGIKAVIFDLDGVIVSTDRYHYLAWKKLTDRLGIYFDEQINMSLRGVSRMESLEIILSNTDRTYSDDQKKEFAEEKNKIYRRSLNELSKSDILPGVIGLLDELDERGIRKAIGSSSRNTKTILDKIGLIDRFDVIVDGTMIRNSKPDPEVFSKAVKMLGYDPEECLVIEDAVAGIIAGHNAGCKTYAVGDANNCELSDTGSEDLSDVNVDKLVNI